MSLPDVQFSGEAKKAMAKTASMLKAMLDSIPNGMTVESFIKEAERVTALPPIYMRTADLVAMERSKDHAPNSPEDHKKLEADIRVNGVLVPLVVNLTEGSYRLIDGVQRLLIADRYGTEMLPVRIFADIPGRGRNDLIETYRW